MPVALSSGAHAPAAGLRHRLTIDPSYFKPSRSPACMFVPVVVEPRRVKLPLIAFHKRYSSAAPRGAGDTSTTLALTLPVLEERLRALRDQRRNPPTRKGNQKDGTTADGGPDAGSSLAVRHPDA